MAKTKGWPSISGISSIFIACLLLDPCHVGGIPIPGPGDNLNACNQILGRYYPRQNLDMEKMLGEWPGISIGWRDKIHAIPPKYVCPSQFYSREANSSNLNILFKFRPSSETILFTELHGIAEISSDNSALWKNVVFREIPGHSMDGVIIATDYVSYAIGIECEIKDGIPVENFVLRSRQRVIPRQDKQIFENFIEGLGFPKTFFFDLPQQNSLCHGRSGQSSKSPS